MADARARLPALGHQRHGRRAGHRRRRRRGRRAAARSSRGSRRAALASDVRSVYQRAGAAPVHGGSRPRRARPWPSAHDGLPERGMDPGAVLQALLGHPNLVQPRVGDDAVRPDGRRRHGRRPASTARPCCASRARRARSSWPPTPSAAVAPLRPRTLARRSRSPSARATSPSPARGRSGVTELPQLRRPERARGVLAASPRPSAAWPTRAAALEHAGHRRQRQLLQRVGARRASRPRPRSAWSACSTTSNAGAAASSGRPATSIGLLGEHDPGPGRLGLRQPRRRRRLDDRPPALDLAP